MALTILMARSLSSWGYFAGMGFIIPSVGFGWKVWTKPRTYHGSGRCVFTGSGLFLCVGAVKIVCTGIFCLSGLLSLFRLV